MAPPKFSTTQSSSAPSSTAHARAARQGRDLRPVRQALPERPVPLYRKLREKDSVHRSRLFPGVLMTRYEDVNAVLRDPRFSADDRNQPDFDAERAKAIAAGVLTQEESERSQSMLRLDPPDHTRLRSLVTRAFTPRAVESLRPRVETIVESCWTRSPAGGDGRDRGPGCPLPVIVIAEMLGIARTEDRRAIQGVVDAIARTTGLLERLRAGAQGPVCGPGAKELPGRCRRGAAKEPREDLLSALLAAEQEGDKLTADEVYATTELLLIAGNETTTNLIGNGLLCVAAEPEQSRRCCEDGGLMRRGRRGAAALRQPGAADLARRHEDMDFQGADSRRARRVLVPRRRQPRPGAVRAIRTTWTLPARTCATWPSGTASTTASGAASPGSRRRSP